VARDVAYKYTFVMTTPTVQKELGQRIRAMRRKKGMTQEDMADRCGLHWTYIGGLERGERNPTLTTMQKIALGLNIPLRDMLDRNPSTTVATPREKKEGKLLKLLRRKDENAFDLATGVVREVLHWRDRYGSKK
jgi:transcriptional regulator with XRE-family HTH domain